MRLKKTIACVLELFFVRFAASEELLHQVDDAQCVTGKADGTERYNTLTESLAQAHQTVQRGLYDLEAHAESYEEVQASLAKNLQDIDALLGQDASVYESFAKSGRKSETTDLEKQDLIYKTLSRPNETTKTAVAFQQVLDVHAKDAKLEKAGILDFIGDFLTPPSKVVPFLDGVKLTFEQSIGLACAFVVVGISFCMLLAFCMTCIPDSDNIYFHIVIDTVIVVNALVICVELRNGESELTFAAENFFNCMFLFEICVRLQDVGLKRFVQSPWDIFNVLLVAVGSWDLWIMPILETGLEGDALSQNQTMEKAVGIFRILRILRVVRLLRPKPKPPPWAIDQDYPAEAWYTDKTQGAKGFTPRSLRERAAIFGDVSLKGKGKGSGVGASGSHLMQTVHQSSLGYVSSKHASNEEQDRLNRLARLAGR